MYFWISAFDHRAIVLDKMHIVHWWEWETPGKVSLPEEVVVRPFSLFYLSCTLLVGPFSCFCCCLTCLLLVQLLTCSICPFAFTYSFFVILSVLLPMHKVNRKVGCSFSQRYCYIARVLINHICFFLPLLRM